jgi:hypothetical protein
MLKLIFIKKLIGNFISDKRCAAAGDLIEHALRRYGHCATSLAF